MLESSSDECRSPHVGLNLLETRGETSQKAFQGDCRLQRSISKALDNHGQCRPTGKSHSINHNSQAINSETNVNHLRQKQFIIPTERINFRLKSGMNRKKTASQNNASRQRAVANLHCKCWVFFLQLLLLLENSLKILVFQRRIGPERSE